MNNVLNIPFNQMKKIISMCYLGKLTIFVKLTRKHCLCITDRVAVFVLQHIKKTEVVFTPTKGKALFQCHG